MVTRTLQDPSIVLPYLIPSPCVHSHPSTPLRRLLSYLPYLTLPLLPLLPLLPFPIYIYPLTSSGTTLLHNSSSLSLVPEYTKYLSFPIYPTTTTTLYLCIPSIPSTPDIQTSKIPFPPHKHHHYNPYYTQITQYPIFPRIHCALGVTTLLSIDCQLSALLHTLHLCTTHLQAKQNLRQSHCRTHDKPSPDTPFASCLELSCSGPVERF